MKSQGWIWLGLLGLGIIVVFWLVTNVPPASQAPVSRDHAVGVADSQTRAIQACLKSLRFYHGPVDGVPNYDMAAAHGQYRRTRRIPREQSLDYSAAAMLRECQ